MRLPGQKGQGEGMAGFKNLTWHDELPCRCQRRLFLPKGWEFDIPLAHISKLKAMEHASMATSPKVGPALLLQTIPCHFLTTKDADGDPAIAYRTCGCACFFLRFEICQKYNNAAHVLVVGVNEPRHTGRRACRC